MTKKLTIIICLFSVVSTSQAVGFAGAESMNRPSAKPLPAIPEKKGDKEDNLELPPVPLQEHEIKSSQKYRVEKINIIGNSVLLAEELKTLIQSYEHRTLYVYEIEEMRQKLTRHYIDKGYINSGAIIPENAINNGELQVKIVEGTLNEVNVSGQERLREGYIKNRLLDDTKQPFNLNELQDRFQNLLSDPLIGKMNGRILPGKAPGQSILDVEVTRAKPYHLAFFGDNYRPPSIGGEAFGLEGWVRNLTGLGDALDFTYIHSEGSNRYAGGFSLPVTDQGTLAFFRFDEGDSTVIEGAVKKLDIESQVHSLEGGISHPIMNKLNQKLTVGALLAIRENETSLLSRPFSFIPGEPTGRNQTTVWRLFQEGMWRGENQALVLRSTLNFGMNALGATPKTPDNFPSSEFFSWLGQGQYAYRVMDNGAQVLLRGNAQFSDSPLLPLEQIAIGGVATVRGYRENHLVRDNGYNLSLEFHYPLVDDADPEYGHKLTLIPFFDYGEAWEHVKTGQSDSDSLYSAGLGLNWKFNILAVDFFYGYALNTPSLKTSGDLQDSGIHFQARLNVF